MPLETRQPTSSANRTQRFLAYFLLVLVGVTVIDIILIAIATNGGLRNNKGFSALWQFIFVFPAVAIPIAFICLIAVIVMGAAERRRLLKESQK